MKSCAGILANKDRVYQETMLLFDNCSSFVYQSFVWNLRVNTIVERIANMKIKGGVYQFCSFPRLVSPLHLSPGILMPKAQSPVFRVYMLHCKINWREMLQHNCYLKKRIQICLLQPWVMRELMQVQLQSQGVLS